MNNTNNTKGYLEYAHKKKRVYDQMTSMHFTLSDKYERMSKIEDTLEIVLSVLLCGLTFCDFDKLGWGQLKNPTLIIGLTSIILFAFTLVKNT